jgi:hypothetical protein
MVKRVVAALCAQAVGAAQYGGQALHHIARLIRVVVSTVMISVILTAP